MEPPIIEVSFSFNGIEQTRISISSCVPEFDPNIISEEAAKSNTSCSYSGRHDHGNLPVLKSSGPYATLISGLLETKVKCDTFLTDLMKLEATSGGLEVEQETGGDIEGEVDLATVVGSSEAKSTPELTKKKARLDV